MRDRFTEVFVSKADLQPDMAKVIKQNIHFGEGSDGEVTFLVAVFFGTGSTYFYYDDRDNSDLLDQWIVEMAELQVENFAAEQDILGITGPERLGS